MSGRNEQVLRIFRVLTMLESSRNGMTVKEIHERIEEQGSISDRTIRRDLEAIELLGFGLQVHDDPSDPQSGGRYTVQSSLKVARHLTLSPRELFSLYMSRGMLAPLRDTMFYGDLQNIFRQIDQIIPPAARDHLEELAQEMKFEPMPGWSLNVHPDLMETVLAACSNAQVLELDYVSALKGEKRRRKLGPHFLYFAKGAVYLVAEDLEDGQYKIFSLARASDAFMTELPYDKVQVEPEEFFRSSFGVYRAETTASIELVFKQEVSAYVIERRWHNSQRVVKHSDGSISLHLEVGITPDLVQFVLGFGDGVAVKAPAELKSRVAEAARRVADLYR